MFKTFNTKKTRNRLSVYTMMIGLIFTAFPIKSYAINTVSAINSKNTERIESDVANKLLSRLIDIYASDKSDMKYAEKKILRKEVMAIKTELAAMDNSSSSDSFSGIYLLLGTILLIVLLIIILY